MNRPILVILIGYIIGIIWGLYFKISIVFFYAIIIGIYILTNIRYKKQKFKIFSIKRYFRYIKLILKINIILTIIISSFISNLIIKFQENKYNNLFKNAQAIETTGIIISNKQEKDYYNRYKIKILDPKVKLYINVNKKIELNYGDKIKLKGEFIKPQIATNYKGFDYKQYLKTLKIYGTIKIEKLEVLEKNQANPILQISNNLFLKIKENIEKTYNKEISGIILGIMLGYTDEIDEQTKEQFSQSNISHVLAVSGMHISYIIILVTNSTQKLLGKRKSKIIASIVLIIYMFIAGAGVSIMRATIMGVISCMSFIVYRKSNTINNIAISGLITLIINPYSIISISFLLTYGGTIGIIFFNQTIEKSIKNIKIRNRKWKYLFLKIQRKCENIIKLASVSISAQIIIAPIMMIFFNTIGFGFLITNLLLGAVIGIIVIGGFAQIIISIFSVQIGTLIADLIEIPIKILLLISKINIGNFKIITPELYQVILYYMVIFIIIYLYKIFHLKYCNQTEQRIKNMVFLIKYKLKPYLFKIKISVIIIILLIIFINQIPKNLKIYFVDVGQGDCTLIITPNNKKILIDGGGSETYDVGKNTLVPYLLDRKIKKLDYIFISHFDQDHVRAEFLV